MTIPTPPNHYSQTFEIRRNSAIEDELRKRETKDESNWQRFGVQLPNFSAASISDVSHNINTQIKKQGRVVFDTTNNRMMIASGSAANDPWYTADGGTSVTPT